LVTSTNSAEKKLIQKAMQSP